MAEASAIIDNSVFMTGSIVKGLEVLPTEGGSMSKRRTNHVYRRCRRCDGSGGDQEREKTRDSRSEVKYT